MFKVIKETQQQHELVLAKAAPLRCIPVLVPYLELSSEKNGGWVVRCTANAIGEIGLESSVKTLAEVLTSAQEWFARPGAAV